MNNVAQCRNCGARILFIRMKSGKSMPVNPTLVRFKNSPGGHDRLVLPSGDVIACMTNVDVDEADGYGYISHFATCPGAQSFRRR